MKGKAWQIRNFMFGHFRLIDPPKCGSNVDLTINYHTYKPSYRNVGLVTVSKILLSRDTHRGTS